MADAALKDKATRMKKWELVIAVALLSDVLIVILNAVISYVTLGGISYDYLVIGALDAMVVPVIIAPFVVYLFNEEREKVRYLTAQAELTMAKAKDASQLAAKKLHDAEEKVQELERLRADFFGTLSGELSSPLSAIILSTNKLKALLADDTLKADDRGGRAASSTESRTDQIARIARGKRAEIIENARDTVDMMLMTGSRLASILNVVVELADIDTGVSEWNDEEVDFVDTMRSAASQYLPVMKERGLSLKEEVQGSGFQVRGDHARLQTLVNNLFNNAVALTDAGGIRYGLRKEAGKLLFEVDDTGWAIPGYMQDAVFGRAKHTEGTASDRIKRTTLILTLCRRIAERHGGEIWLESKGGTGNKVVVSLPLMHDPATIWRQTMNS